MTLLLLATCFLAYANGANDNFKGVASLFGSRTASYRVAILWATVTTFCGSVCAVFLAQTLLKKFSGKGLVPDEVAGSGHFVLAVALGAGITVIVATVAGFPVSTTHGLTGAMIGSGLMAAGSQVNFQALGKGFLLPLLLGPFLAVLMAAPLYLALHRVRLRLGIAKSLESDGSYLGTMAGAPSQKLMDAGHFLSAGVVSFARGLNDTPKIAAMLLILKGLDMHWGTVAVAAAMAAGGLLNARRVAETMSLKITRMNHGQGFSANLATGALVILASLYGLPVSTTHVSVGSLSGIGLVTGQANPRVMAGIALSWVLTLPCAVALGGLAWRLTTSF